MSKMSDLHIEQQEEEHHVALAELAEANVATKGEQMTTDTMNTGLTELEVKLLDACLNHDVRAGQLEDNFSNGDLPMAYRICGGKHQAAGVIGSLCKKGLIVPPEQDWSPDGDMIWLTEDGVNAIFDHKENK